MKLKVRSIQGFEQKTIGATVKVRYAFPLPFFEDKNGIVSIEYDAIKSKIADELRGYLFSDAFGKIPAIEFSFEDINLNSVKTLKKMRIDELKKELSKLTGESQ